MSFLFARTFNNKIQATSATIFIFDFYLILVQGDKIRPLLSKSLLILFILLMEDNINSSTRQIINDSTQKKEQLRPISFRHMFRFATSFDYALMTIGTICACALGTAMPGFAILLGDMTDAFSKTSDDMVEAGTQIMYKFIYVAIAELFAGWGALACWMITSERQGIACRKEYLKSLLKQEIGWFDTINQSELATNFAADCFAFQGAIGQKLSTVMMTITMFVVAAVISFYTGWLIALVYIATLPVIALGGYIYSTVNANKDKAQESQYAQAGGLAEQAIAAIKTVKQLNGQQFQAENYSNRLKSVTEKACKYGAYMGLGMAILFSATLASYSLVFWFGSQCVEGTSSCPPNWNGDKIYTAGSVVTVVLSLLMAGFNLNQLVPTLKKIAEGRNAGARIYVLIDRQPTIKSTINPIQITSFKGVFRFESVTFAYPKDKSKKVLQDLNLVIDSKAIGLVGESGCGKSTIFQLMMRFYDPDQGRITLDDVDLRVLDLTWLRAQIGFVGQEPVLFATSIRENMLFGKEDATEEEINTALKKAEAYEFVNNLTDKLQTYVGMGGGRISGGQKQRIAIARAILKNPKVLLLDEATSSLDRRNEKLIQNTLKKIEEQKITITIAHRVKTIVDCSKIYVLDRGAIIEQGRFHELKKYKGHEELLERESEDLDSPNLKRHLSFESIVTDKAVQQQIKKDEEARDPLLTSSATATKAHDEIDKKYQQAIVEKYSENTFRRLFTYCSHRKLIYALGIFLCLVNGAIFPVFSIFFSKMMGVLVKFKYDPISSRRDANTYALIFVLLGVLAFIVQLLQHIIFNVVGEEMTDKIRKQTYLKILKMPVPWFDKPRNSSGSLSARLALDSQKVNKLTTIYISILVENSMSLISGVIIAFFYEWRTSLVAFGLLPFMIIAGVCQNYFANGFSAQTDKAYQDSSNLITEAMINIRTVTSFGYADMLERKYSECLKDPYLSGVKIAHIAGLMYGVSMAILFVAFALLFHFGTIFLRDNGLSVQDVFSAIYVLINSSVMAGSYSQFMPDVAAGKISAANLFEILDGEDEDELQVKEESKMLKQPIMGHLHLKGVYFKYESRDEYVLQDMNLDIPVGWKIGIVGHSGQGKSTILQLLQRFYEPTKGEILLDGVNLKDYDIHFLRSNLGVVSQEPVLFNETIGNNIKYNRHDATHEEIVEAANESYFNPEVHHIEQVHGSTIYDSKAQEKQLIEKDRKDPQQLIKKNGSGFDKNVGVKGSHISGGQKQRVAIARVILRRPKVLLLDEGTSALDSINQRAVQDSLDRIMANKTAINIAHRISTVRNSNQIIVLQKGRIIEKGSYAQLMQVEGYFYKLERGLQFV